ncbi:MAG: hypothetical protein GY799_26345, partial [Desulfobulbaceae bacterium]|nr:hypothetical protein [Desulfobulbaceae bacterium]
MKSIIFIAMGVCILCFGSMAQVDAAEVQIPPGVMTATAKATEGPARTPDHVVDGSGMTGLAHSNGHADNQMWHSPNTTNRWFRVDLGSSYDLGNMVIYNLNWAGLTGRGCKNVEVFYSNSGTDPGNPRDNPGNWTAFGSAFDLTQAPGASDYGTTNAVTPDVVDLTGTTARWVSLKINSVYASGYGGLSEILFYSVITAESDAPTPNPATFASGPAALSDTVVKMTATIGSDATGPVEYLFTNTTLATDSGWVTSPVHIDTGLDSGTQYTYTVQMRDSSSTPNVGTASDPNDATTFSAAAISGMTATAKATEGAARTPDHVVDGSGMTGLAHSNVHADNLMWHSPNTTGRWFKVDLGVSYFVDYMVIYNINWATLTSRGCKNVEVFYSNSDTDPGNPIDDPGNWTAFGSAFDLTQAPGASDYGTTNAVKPDVVDFSGTTARWVSIKVNSKQDGLYGGLSEILFYGEPETDPPTPNAATFATAPYATGTDSIAMVATTGTDATGPVEYYFDETSGNSGGTDSDWQTSPNYTDNDLDAGTQYTYTVQMRDALDNTGIASAPASATTDAGIVTDDFNPTEDAYVKQHRATTVTNNNDLRVRV